MTKDELEDEVEDLRLEVAAVRAQYGPAWEQVWAALQIARLRRIVEDSLS